MKKLILSIFIVVSLVFVGWTIINNKPSDGGKNRVNSDKIESPDEKIQDSTASESKQHAHKKPAREDKKGCVVHL